MQRFYLTQHGSVVNETPLHLTISVNYLYHYPSQENQGIRYPLFVICYTLFENIKL